MGGRVTYDYYEGYMSFEYDEHGTLILHRELPGPDWLCELIGVDFFASVVEVSLGTDRVNDLSPLKELKKLKKLILFPFQVADEDIAALQKGATRLRSVDPINRLEMRELSLSVTVS